MYQQRGTLHGILVTHVDDFLWRRSHVFVDTVIKPQHKIFEIGSVNKKAFQYIGLDLEKGDSSIVISHSTDVDSINSLKLDGKKAKNRLINETDRQSRFFDRTIQLIDYANKTRYPL